jgi:hypothetical protein
MNASVAPDLSGYVRAYISAGHCAHLLPSASRIAVCGAQADDAGKRYGRPWLGIRDGGGPRAVAQRERAAQLPACCRCRRQAAVLEAVRLAAEGRGETGRRPGELAVVELRGRRWPVAECASCEEVGPIQSRGLCFRCYDHHQADGTLGEYGYVREDRIADYMSLRRAGLTCEEAAARVGVTARTGYRYEREYRQSFEVAA